jgi:ABC-type branched-subunit amino acid transport system substrate-binding protein
VYPRSDINAGVFESIMDQSKTVGLSLPQAIVYLGGHLDASATVKQCKSSGRNVLFFLGSSEDARSLIREAEKQSWYPWLFLPGSSLGGEVLTAPAGFDGRVFLSFPTSPADQSAEGMKEFRMLAEKYKLPTDHLAAQISAYGAAKVLVEGLKRAGKDLSREKLIQALEGLYDYQTGLIPAITYGPNRRIGANGARVVTIDLKEKKFLPVSGWIEVK